MRIKFDYRNHRGEVNQRDVTVRSLTYLVAPGWGYEPGFFLIGYDHRKAADRTFALTNIIQPEQLDVYDLVEFEEKDDL